MHRLCFAMTTTGGNEVFSNIMIGKLRPPLAVWEKQTAAWPCAQGLTLGRVCRVGVNGRSIL
jgi:hypothetical protein